MELVELVRTKLSGLEKKNVCPLIVQGVHEREIVKNLQISHTSSLME